MTAALAHSSRLRALFERSAQARYAAAVGLFLVALAIRVALAPAIASGYGITCF